MKGHKIPPKAGHKRTHPHPLAGPRCFSLNEFCGEGRKLEGASLPGPDAKKMILVLLREKNPIGAESGGDNGMD